MSGRKVGQGLGGQRSRGGGAQQPAGFRCAGHGRSCGPQEENRHAGRLRGQNKTPAGREIVTARFAPKLKNN